MTLKSPKVVKWVQIVMGLALLFFGGMGLFQIGGELPEMAPAAQAFMDALIATGYILPLLSLAFVIVGVMYVANRAAPLGTLMLFPLTLNILFFHLFLDMTGISIAIIFFIINLYLVWIYAEKYMALCRK